MTSRAGYWIGAGLIVAGVAGAILWGVLSFTAMGDTVDDFQRAPAPGMARVELEARKYIVYVEGPGVRRDNVEILIVDRSGDGVLPLADYSASLTYAMSGHSGSAVATVTPPRAGVYSLRAATTAAPSAGLQVALGDSIAGRIVRTLLGAFAIGGSGAGGGDRVDRHDGGAAQALPRGAVVAAAAVGARRAGGVAGLRCAFVRFALRGWSDGVACWGAGVCAGVGERPYGRLAGGVANGVSLGGANSPHPL